MNNSQIISLIGQLEVTYRQLSRVAFALCEVNGVLALAATMPPEARADKCAPLSGEVEKALSSALKSIEDASQAACVLYPKNS